MVLDLKPPALSAELGQAAPGCRAWHLENTGLQGQGVRWIPRWVGLSPVGRVQPCTAGSDGSYPPLWGCWGLSRVGDT